MQVAAPDQAELSGLALVPNTPSLVSFTRKGYIKRVPTNTYSPQRRGGKGMSGGRLREADVLEEVVPAMAHDTLLLLAGSGRCYTLPAYKVPQSTRTAAGTAAVQVGGQDLVPWF
jgi:DNA gyrase subunit A